MPRYIVIAHNDDPTQERIVYTDNPANDTIVAELNYEQQLALDHYDASELALAVAVAVDLAHLQDWLEALTMAFRHTQRLGIASALPAYKHAYFAHLD